MGKGDTKIRGLEARLSEFLKIEKSEEELKKIEEKAIRYLLEKAKKRPEIKLPEKVQNIEYLITILKNANALTNIDIYNFEKNTGYLIKSQTAHTGSSKAHVYESFFADRKLHEAKAMGTTIGYTTSLKVDNLAMLIKIREEKPEWALFPVLRRNGIPTNHVVALIPKEGEEITKEILQTYVSSSIDFLESIGTSNPNLITEETKVQQINELIAPMQYLFALTADQDEIYRITNAKYLDIFFPSKNRNAERAEKIGFNLNFALNVAHSNEGYQDFMKSEDYTFTDGGDLIKICEDTISLALKKSKYMDDKRTSDPEKITMPVQETPAILAQMGIAQNEAEEKYKTNSVEDLEGEDAILGIESIISTEGAGEKSVNAFIVEEEEPKERKLPPPQEIENKIRKIREKNFNTPKNTESRYSGMISKIYHGTSKIIKYATVTAAITIGAYFLPGECAREEPQIIAQKEKIKLEEKTEETIAQIKKEESADTTIQSSTIAEEAKQEKQEIAQIKKDESADTEIKPKDAEKDVKSETAYSEIFHVKNAKFIRNIYESKNAKDNDSRILSIKATGSEDAYMITLTAKGKAKDIENSNAIIFDGTNKYRAEIKGGIAQFIVPKTFAKEIKYAGIGKIDSENFTYTASTRDISLESIMQAADAKEENDAKTAMRIEKEKKERVFDELDDPELLRLADAAHKKEIPVYAKKENYSKNLKLDLECTISKMKNYLSNFKTSKAYSAYNMINSITTSDTVKEAYAIASGFTDGAWTLKDRAKNLRNLEGKMTIEEFNSFASYVRNEIANDMDKRISCGLNYALGHIKENNVIEDNNHIKNAKKWINMANRLRKENKLGEGVYARADNAREIYVREGLYNSNKDRLSKVLAA